MTDRKTTEMIVNKLCRKCMRNCRQDESILLVDCPRYMARPFKSEELQFDQLDLFGNSTSED